jgi:hypothetical protein
LAGKETGPDSVHHLAVLPIRDPAERVLLQPIPAFSFEEDQMSANNTYGTILIRDNTLLPAGLTVESESFLPGWKAVKNLDGYGLARKMEDAKWNYFYLAGVTRTMVLGHEGPETMRRAVRSALAKLDRLKFNSLEITNVVSKRFLGIPFTSVAIHSRHIQEAIGLVPTKEFVLSMPAPVPIGEALTEPRVALNTSS